jgi:hypothetical protein
VLTDTSARAAGGRGRLTNVGGVRDALLVWLRGRGKRLCARVACPAWPCGPSTSPLDAIASVRYASSGCARKRRPTLGRRAMRLGRSGAPRATWRCEDASGSRSDRSNSLWGSAAKSIVYHRCGPSGALARDPAASLVPSWPGRPVSSCCDCVRVTLPHTDDAMTSNNRWRGP